MTQLEKAKLKGLDGAQDIDFMFNPTELTFSRSMSIEQSPGARDKSGQNKTSFKHPNPYTLKIGNLIFDTYETQKSVLDQVKKLSKSVEFTDKGKGQNKRPPIYLFAWGQHDYLRAFVKDFSCRLTLFLPNGTPVRAIIDLTLEQVELPQPTSDQGPANPSSSDRTASKPLFG
ncbi:MAG: hypothetical protein AAFY20_07590 [Cyanobacteria bacterium J06639_14]